MYVSIGRSVSNVCSKSSVRSVSNLSGGVTSTSNGIVYTIPDNAILESGRQNISNIVILNKYTRTNLISHMILHSVHKYKKKTSCNIFILRPPPQQDPEEGPQQLVG